MASEYFTDERIERYSRQIILPEVGGKGQLKLHNSKVLVVGAGGLGSPVIAYLAAAGVGTLGIIDSDLVELSNLQRQIIHGGHVGMPKARSAMEFAKNLNSDVGIIACEERLSADNAREIIRGYDFIVDGSDNFPTRYLVNDVCVIEDKPFSHGSITMYDGYATTIIPRQGPCYRCIFKKPPPPGAIPTCQEAGVFGVLPGTIGTIQASEALKFLLGIGDLLVGRMICYNALDMSFCEVRAKRDKACPVCGDQLKIKEIKPENYIYGICNGRRV